MKVRKAVIPAAGLGTRFLPATKAAPKEMLPIVDKPAIQYIVEEAIASGIEDILIITGKGKRSIEDHFDKSFELEHELRMAGKEDLLHMLHDMDNLINIHYIRQKEPRGLGHAIYCARAFVGNEPFAVLLPDDLVDAEEPCLKQLMGVYDEYRATVIGVQPVEIENVSKYGIISGRQVKDKVYSVEDMVEKPDMRETPSNIAIMSRYIITPKVFELLENATPGKGGEIQLTDALKELLKHEKVYAYNFTGKRYDVGYKLGFLKATVEYALKRDDLKDEFYGYLRGLMEEYKSN